MISQRNSILLIFATIFSLSAKDIAPIQVASWPGFVRGNAGAVAAAGKYVYAQVGDNEFVVFDVSIAEKPVPISSLQTAGEIRSIVLRGDFAYVMGRYNSEIIDLTNPATPKSVRTNSWGGSISFLGDYGYAAQRANAFDVFDVSAPASPKRVRAVASRNPGLMAISQNVGYVYHTDRIEIMDLSDPSNPMRISDFALPNDLVRAINTYSNYVLVAVTEDRSLPPYYSYFKVIDLRNPHDGRVVAKLPISPWSTEIAVFGDRAYVTTAAGLEIFELSDPLDPKSMGAYKSLSEPSVTISQGRGYLGDGGGLVVIDLNDTNFPILGTYSSAASSEAVEVFENYAYVADGTGGLRIVDVSDPLLPRLVGEATTFTNSTGISWSNGYVFVEEKGFGLEIFDVRVPSTPHQVSSYSVPYEFNSALFGTNLVISTVAGLEIVSIPDPSQPKRVGIVSMSGSPEGLVVAQNYAFVAGHFQDGELHRSGIRVIDITNPRTPRVVGLAPSESPNGFAGTDTHLFVSGSALAVYDISDPARPKFKTKYSGAGYSKLLVKENHLFTQGSAQMGMIDITNPLKAELVGLFPVSGSVATNGRYAYIADRAAGLKIFDIGNPAVPVRNGSWALTNELFSFSQSYSGRSIAVSAKNAYIVDGGGNLQVLDVSDSHKPFRANWVERGASGDRGVEVFRDHLFIGDYLSPAHIFDLHNPTFPRRVGSFGSNISFISGSGSYAAAIGFEAETVQLWDVSNAAAPVVITNYPTGQIVSTVSLTSNELHLGLRYGSLQTVDISDPLAPRWGSLVSNLGGDVRAIDVREPYLYVAAADSLKILDRRNPQQPVLVGNVRIPGSRSVVVVDNFAYVAGSLAIHVVDISAPSTPRLVGSNSAVAAQDLVVSGDKIYATGYFNTLSVLTPYRPQIAELRISHLTLTEAGSVQFVVDGPEGGHVEIERTSDLTAPWNPVTTIVLSDSSRTITDDPLPATVVFYRATLAK